MPEHHARKRLDFQVQQAGALLLREIAHLGLSEADVGQILPGQPPKARLDLGFAQAVVAAVPAVEADRKLAHRLVAARGDVGEDGLHRLAHPTIGLSRRLSISASLQPLGHPAVSIEYVCNRSKPEAVQGRPASASGDAGGRCRG